MIDFSKRSEPSGPAKIQTKHFQFIRDNEVMIHEIDLENIITRFLVTTRQNKPFWMGIEIELSWQQWQYVYIEMFSRNELSKSLFRMAVLDVIEVENKSLHFVSFRAGSQVAIGELKFVCVEIPASGPCEVSNG